MTVREAIDSILARIPGVNLERTVDTFKGGDPDAALAGVATTFMATRTVLARAVELKANLVITHEPTYYNHLDETDWLTGDAVYESKRRYIDENRLVVWRFHDYWHRIKPDGILTGMARRLGWEKYQSPPGSKFLVFPPTTAGELAESARRALGARLVRIAGDSATPISRVFFEVGAMGGREQIADLMRDDVDAVVCGESPEWETCEYVRDSAAAGRKKALIVLGHCDSEEAGMEYLAEWLRPLFPGVPVHFVPAGNPFKNLGRVEHWRDKSRRHQRPLVEPYVRFSRIRLTDTVHSKACA